MHHTPTNGIKSAGYGLGLSYDRERLQVALIRGAADIDAPGNVSQTLAHGHPVHAGMAFPGHPSADFEPSRIIDRRLDPQYAPLLVVDLDRVLFDPVFDANAFNTFDNFTGDLAGKAPVRATPQET